jgi:hypothetical protein
MTDKIDAFIAAIASHPVFVAAAMVDPKRNEDLAAIERGIAAVYRCPEMIDIFDKIQAVIDRRHVSYNRRLLDIGKLLEQARDLGRSVN